VTCPVDTSGYLFDGSFAEIGNSGFWDGNGNVTFPDHPHEYATDGCILADGNYQTEFGPLLMNDAVRYAYTNSNASKAWWRLWKARGPLQEHQELRDNQAQFTAANAALLEELFARYHPFLTEYRGMEEEARVNHDAPHPKRLLRVQAFDELTNQAGRFNIGERLWIRSVWYKMKKNEDAKPGKVPRGIGDLGVAASLQGFVVTKLLKNAMAALPLTHHGLSATASFIPSPSPDSLSALFLEHQHPIWKYTFHYFSDDSVLTVQTRSGALLHCNLDISACDTSHTDALYEKIISMAPPHILGDLERLMAQLKLPIRIVDRHNRRNKLLLRPLGYKLYSGHTATTWINNCACLWIWLSITLSGAETPEEITAACRKAGYNVTVEVCPIIQDMQFLKHSPVIDTSGEMRAIVNLGVLLRASGRCYGDLPGRGDIFERARAFQQALLQGIYPRTHFTLIDSMKSMVAGETSLEATAKVAELFQFKVLDDGAIVHVSDTELYKRYRLSDYDIDRLHAFACHHGVGYFYSDSGAVETILNRDYGLHALFT